jgi:chemotaxis protein CheZ
MSDDHLALSPPAAPQPTEADYEAICAAVMETARGRWFLAEYAKRNRHADTETVLNAIARLESAIRGGREASPAERMRFDLIEMANAISRTKAEIAAIKPEGEHHGRLLEATEELDSIVQTTERATSDILAAAEQIQEIAWTLRERGADSAACSELDQRATDIYSACSFQDLTGQRTRKVIQTMRYLEERIAAMIAIWGEPPGPEPAERNAQTGEANDHLEQPDIDRMMPGAEPQAAGAGVEPVAADGAPPFSPGEAVETVPAGGEPGASTMAGDPDAPSYAAAAPGPEICADPAASNDERTAPPEETNLEPAEAAPIAARLALPDEPPMVAAPVGLDEPAPPREAPPSAIAVEDAPEDAGARVSVADARPTADAAPDETEAPADGPAEAPAIASARQGPPPDPADLLERILAIIRASMQIAETSQALLPPALQSVSDQLVEVALADLARPLPMPDEAGLVAAAPPGDGGPIEDLTEGMAAAVAALQGLDLAPAHEPAAAAVPLDDIAAQSEPQTLDSGAESVMVRPLSGPLSVAEAVDQMLARDPAQPVSPTADAPATPAAPLSEPVPVVAATHAPAQALLAEIAVPAAEAEPAVAAFLAAPDFPGDDDAAGDPAAGAASELPEIAMPIRPPEAPRRTAFADVAALSAEEKIALFS